MTFFLDQFKPVTGRSVQCFALAWNQTWDDLVEDRDLVGVTEFNDVWVLGGPDLLDFAVIDHFAHVYPHLGWPFNLLFIGVAALLLFRDKTYQPLENSMGCQICHLYFH